MYRLFIPLILLLAIWSGGANAAATGSVVSAAPLNFERGGNWLVNPAPADVALRLGAGSQHVKISLYRLTDPALLTQVMTARAARSLGEGELLRRVADGSAPIWRGELTPDPARPVMQLPLDILAGEVAANGALKLGNGVYVLTAAVGDGADEARATQWFMHTSLDVATRFYGRHALVTLYDMATRQPQAGLSLAWLDAAGKALGDPVVTDTSGTAWLDRPQQNAVLLMATADQNRDMAFAPVPQGNAPSIERALILPDAVQTGAGQSVSALVATANGGDITAKLGNGATAQSMNVTPIAGGLYRVTGDVPPGTSGSTIALEVSAGDQLLARKILPVSFNPDLRLDWQQKPATAIGAGKLVYKFHLRQSGKDVAGKPGKLIVTANAGPGTDSLGLPDIAPVALPFTTDRAGVATVSLTPSQLPWRTETAPSYASVNVALGDAPVGDAATLSLYPARSWLEITPGFTDNAIAEGATARFTAHIGSADGKPSASEAPLDWQLARETYKFEWYQADDGRWTYRTNTTLAQVAAGHAPLAHGGKANNKSGNKDGAIAVPVGAGRYRLTVTDPVAHLTASLGFTAGWWLAPVATASPEKIALKAQMEKAKGGRQHLAVFVDPPFAARVWLTATTAAGAHTVVQNVPDEGAFIYIDQTDLPAGQPLTLNAFAIPASEGATLAQALGNLTLPLGAPLTLSPVTLSARQPTPVAIDGLTGGSKALLQILDDDGAVTYATAPLDVTDDGKIRATLPSLAIDTAPVLRVLATDGDNNVTLTELHPDIDGDVTLDLPPVTTATAGAAATLRVTINSRRDIKDKMRLSLVGGDAAASITVPSLKAGKPQTVRLPIGIVKAGQKDLLLRLEAAHEKLPLAARPLRLIVR